MAVDYATPVRSAPQWYFKAAGHYVPKATAECFRRQGFHVADIVLNWPSIVGHSLSQYTLPGRIKWPKRATGAETQDKPAGRPARTSLELWVDGGRALDVQYGAKQIIDRINTYFGYNAITELRVVQGPVKSDEPRTAVRVRPVQMQANHVCTEANGIDHEPLRAALTRLGASIRAGR